MNQAREIRTARLFLRPLTIGDTDEVWGLDQDPEVMRFISGGVPTPREVTEGVMIPRMLQVHVIGPQYGFWSAELRSGGDWVGWFHLRPERLEPFEMELGYRLARRHWGKGLATEGSRGLMARAFRGWNLPRIAARTLCANLPSQRVMEKCGMHRERDFTYPPEWLPGQDEGWRRAVRYVVDAKEFPYTEDPA